jgi:hypothetical protein
MPTVTVEKTTHPIHDDPALKAAMRTSANVQERLQDAAALTRSYELLMSPDSEPIDEVLRLEALASYASARIKLLKLEAEFIAAQRVETAARDAARQRAIDSFRLTNGASCRS